LFDFLKQVASHRIVACLFRIFLGITLLYASYDKILHPEAFAEAVANYRLLPLGLFIRSSALVASLLFLVFSIALSSAVVRGVNIDCGCFTVTGVGHTVTLSLVIRDLGYLLASIHILLFDRGFLSMSALLRQPLRRG